MMKLAILSRSLKAYSTRRLKEAAIDRGIDVKVLDTLKFAIDLERGTPDLYFRQKRLRDYDAVLPRIGASITYYGTAVVRQFQEMDVFCANTAHGIANSRDKLRSLQILARHHIGIPETVFVRDKKDVLPAIERVGGAPVIIKLIEGTQGIGVLLADTVKAAESIIELLQSQKQNVLIQTQIMGLRVAGVDMLESATGPQIMEVNSSPGLEGIETCTQLDVAGAIIDYISAQVEFPEIDIRQRLTVSKGYGVSEIYVPEGSGYVGKQLSDIDLSEKDLNVLTLYRGNKVIPNPRKDRVLEPEDKLLCFGKLESMRGMVPARTRSRRRPKVLELPDTEVTNPTSPESD
jgi:ribosomal protein S6--L-glutamate ligase